MATIDNYIGALEDAIKKGNIERIQEAKASLIEFIRSSISNERNIWINNEQKKVYNDLEGDLDTPKIDHPVHYQSYNPEVKIECIEAMRAAFGDEAVAIWCKLNAFKYNWRADSKGGNVDIGKAVWYLNKYLELNK